MHYQIIIIGGGIVGLATALQLLKKNHDLKILLLEKEKELAKHQTGHNSGVIHSGIYYKPGSLKALNCIRGYTLLTNFCKEHEIPFELCGKIIVATSRDEVPHLKNLFERGQQNGISDLTQLGTEELKEYEPHVNGIKGIHVPQTGIIDYRSVAKKYGELIVRKGGEIRMNEKVTKIQKDKNGCTVETTKTNYYTNLVINCCGLYSDTVSRMTEKHVPFRIIPFRGEYYTLKKEKQHLVNNLIYPVPNPDFPFLGVHFTRMLNGTIEAGPNAVFALKREGYKKNDINPAELTASLAWPGFQKLILKYWKTGIKELYKSYSKTTFTKAIQKLVPAVQKEDLIQGGAGVRAQACDRNGNLIDDFLIMESKHTINVCNAPSPAATSSLAIGETLSDIVQKKL